MDNNKNIRNLLLQRGNIWQDLNVTIDQLDKKNILDSDEDIISRTMFIVNSKRWDKCE